MSDQPQRKRPVRRRPKLDHANPIDTHVGMRVRLRRTLLGMSQEKLGEAIGLTFQQVQKYERGANRIGASRLWELSNVLDVPVQFFFSDMTEETVAQMNLITSSQGTAQMSPPTYEPDPLARRETLELVRAYYRIDQSGIRRRLFELTKTLAATVNPAADEDEDGGLI
jgi:transcriptional regulator with XRE-family HTH domain